MASEWALQLAATAWCAETTRNTVMDGVLAEAFAEILDDVKLKLDSKFQTHVLKDEHGNVLHACMTASFPLPKDHWIYAEPVEPEVVLELPENIQSKVLDALRYTIQVCTSLGKDMDFDPDAVCMTMRHTLFQRNEVSAVADESIEECSDPTGP